MQAKEKPVMTSRLTPEQRTALAHKLLIRSATGKGLSKEQKQEARRHAGNLEAANKLEQRMQNRKKLN